MAAGSHPALSDRVRSLWEEQCGTKEGLVSCLCVAGVLATSPRGRFVSVSDPTSSSVT